MKLAVKLAILRRISGVLLKWNTTWLRRFIINVSTGKRDPRVHYFRWNQWPKYCNSSRWGDCTLRPYIKPSCSALSYWLSCLWIRSSRFKVLVDSIIHFDGGRNFSVQFRLLPGQTLNVLSPSNLKDTSSANWIILNSLSENSLFLHDNSSAHFF